MIARRLLAAHPDLAGIYNIGSGPAGIAAALMDDARRRRPLFISHESTPATRRLLNHGIVDTLVHPDHGPEARSAAQVLLALCSGEHIPPAPETTRLSLLLPHHNNIKHTSN